MMVTTHCFFTLAIMLHTLLVNLNLLGRKHVCTYLIYGGNFKFTSNLKVFILKSSKFIFCLIETNIMQKDMAMFTLFLQGDNIAAWWLDLTKPLER